MTEPARSIVLFGAIVLILVAALIILSNEGII